MKINATTLFQIKILQRCLDAFKKSSNCEYKSEEYNVLRNNCEHFVKWARNGKLLSLQSLALVHSFAFVAIIVAIVLLAVGASVVYQGENMPSNETDINYCCNSQMYVYNYTTKKMVSNQEKKNDFSCRDTKIDLNGITISGKICEECSPSRNGNLFNVYEISFWAAIWVVLAALPWINTIVLSQPNRNFNYYNYSIFSILTLPIIAAAAFPIQNLITKKCCSYVLFSIHPIVMAILAFLVLTSRCFSVPSIYKFSDTWKWFNKKVERTLRYFTYYTALWSFYELYYLYHTFMEGLDSTCDGVYFWFVVIFACIVCLSLIIGLIYIILFYLAKEYQSENRLNRNRPRIIPW